MLVAFLSFLVLIVSPLVVHSYVLIHKIAHIIDIMLAVIYYLNLVMEVSTELLVTRDFSCFKCHKM